MLKLKRQAWHPCLRLKTTPWDMGRQLSTYCSESYLSLANFRLPSTDTEDVSTSVEQSLVHLSSPSSSLAELNPLTFSFLPCFLLPPFLRLPLLHYFAGIVVQLQKHLCCSIFLSQDHQSHRWVYSGTNQSSCFWGWPWRMWVLPLAGDCGCLVWA